MAKVTGIKMITTLAFGQTLNCTCLSRASLAVTTGEHMKKKEDTKMWKAILKHVLIKKLVCSVSKSVNNLQWEMDRVSSGGQIELKRLERETTELERLCR